MMIKLAFETNLNFTTYLLTFENRQQNEKKVFQNKKKSKNVQILWKIYENGIYSPIFSYKSY